MNTKQRPSDDVLACFLVLLFLPNTIKTFVESLIKDKNYFNCIHRKSYFAARKNIAFSDHTGNEILSHTNIHHISSIP